MREKLRNLGWYSIGEGHFADVFMNPEKSYVLKITTRSDPGYAKYVDLIHTYKNKYFPHISDKKFLAFDGATYGVYLIEKLQEVNEWCYSHAIESLVTGRSLEKILADFSSLEYYNDIKALLSDPELIRAARILRYGSKTGGFTVDLHDNNVMKRSDGSFVITDPYSFYHAYQQKKDYSTGPLAELAKPKIGKRIEKIAFDYFPERSQVSKNGNGGNYGLKVDELFETRLKKLGWKFMERGKFSVVFENPKKNFILKVNIQPDAGYDHYVDIVKSSRNPHFPKISDKKTLDLSGEGGRGEIFSVYLIEKLYKISDRSERQMLADIFVDVIRYHELPLKRIFNICGTDIPEYLLKRPTLVTALRIVGGKMGRFNNDLHGGNIMKRKDGTVVITDPYVDYTR